MNSALAIVVLAAATTLTPLAFPEQWSAWQSVAPITFAPITGDRYVRVPLDESVDAGSDGRFASVRVVRRDAIETPYALDPKAHRDNDSSTKLSIVDSGFVPGSYTQAVVDFGTAGSVHEALRLTTSRSTYFERVSVEASDDRTTWRELRNDAIVYAVASDATGHSDSGNQTIAFAATRSRWVRLRVLDGAQRFPIDSAFTDDAPVRDALMPVKTFPTFVLDGHKQIWTYSFGVAHVGVSAVELVGTKTPYARVVSVETSDDGTTFQSAATLATMQFRHGGPAPSSLFDLVSARFVRITIDNGDDVPVVGLHPVLLREPHELVFLAEPGYTYVLLASTYVTKVPEYDLASVLASYDWHTDRVATLGTVQQNGGFRDPRPLTERLPWLVGVAFALAALVLGGLAFVTIRSTSAADETSNA